MKISFFYQNQISQNRWVQLHQLTHPKEGPATICIFYCCRVKYTGCAKSIDTMVIASRRFEPHSLNFVGLLEISSQRYPANFKTFGFSFFD